MDKLYKYVVKLEVATHGNHWDPNPPLKEAVASWVESLNDSETSPGEYLKVKDIQELPAQ